MARRENDSKKPRRWRIGAGILLVAIMAVLSAACSKAPDQTVTLVLPSLGAPAAIDTASFALDALAQLAPQTGVGLVVHLDATQEALNVPASPIGQARPRLQDLLETLRERASLPGEIGEAAIRTLPDLEGSVLWVAPTTPIEQDQVNAVVARLARSKARVILIAPQNNASQALRDASGGALFSPQQENGTGIAVVRAVADSLRQSVQIRRLQDTTGPVRLTGGQALVVAYLPQTQATIINTATALPATISMSQQLDGWKFDFLATPGTYQLLFDDPSSVTLAQVDTTSPGGGVGFPVVPVVVAGVVLLVVAGLVIVIKTANRHREAPAGADMAETRISPATLTAGVLDASLTVRNGPQAGQSFAISGGTTTIGRSEDIAVVLEDPSVSRLHARISQQGSDFFLEDLGSSAGTMLDGAPVQRPERLSSGNVIRLGDTELTFEAPAVARADATEVSPKPQAASATMVLGREKGAAWLLVQKGARAGQSFVLQGDTITIGRSPDSTISLEDQAVSREHALICRVEERYVLYDAGSGSGTSVNGQELTGAGLKEGSCIALGSSELEFSIVEGGLPESAGGTVVMRQERHGVLVVRSGPAAGQSFTFGDELVIGREPGPGGAVLDDPAVSLRHALVRKIGEDHVVYDLGSTNGTIVDETKLLGRTLQNGDTIEVGDTVLQFGQA